MHSGCRGATPYVKTPESLKQSLLKAWAQARLRHVCVGVPAEIADFFAGRARGSVLPAALVLLALMISIPIARGEAFGRWPPDAVTTELSPEITRTVSGRTGDAWVRGHFVQMAGQQKRSVNPRDIFHGMMVPGMESEKACKTPDEIHKRLKRQGWWDFDALERTGKDFTVRARRPNGRAYKLTIEACTGRVLGAKRLDNGGRGYRLWPR